MTPRNSPTRQASNKRSLNQRSSRSLRLLSIVCLLSLALTLGGETTSSHALSSLPDFTELAEKNSKAVVNISTRQNAATASSRIPPQFRDLPEDWLEFFFNIPDGPRGGPRGDQLGAIGSGFIVDEDGYIVTNHHVIKDADEVIVRLNDMRSLKAEVIGSDPRTDLALIKVDGDEDFPHIKFGDSDNLKVGAWVFAIGSPFGFDYSVTSGIVSAKGRSLPNDAYVPFIQTDVAINPGNSGGPLFNLDGEVIGVNSQIYSRSGGFMGLSFAIPVNLIKFVIKQLRDEGEVQRGYLGVAIQEITSELSETFDMEFPHGALVSSVIANSPAEKSGIQVGDVITHFNDKLIRRSYELPPIVGITDIGERVPLIVQRNGSKVTIYARIEVLEDDTILTSQQASSQSGEQFRRAGVTIKPLPEDIKNETGAGVLVDEVTPNGSANRAGIEEGDVILSLQGQEVNSIRDFANTINQIESNRRIRVLIWREGRTLFTTMYLSR